MVGDLPDIVGEGSISDLGDLKGWWNNHAIVAWSFVLFGCFLLNVTLLLAFLIRPSLRTISNRFVMNLTVSNLLVCAIMNPLLIMDAASTSSNSFIVESQSIGSICAISEGGVAVVTTSSVFSVLLIAVDQYFAVVDPLRYRARVDKLKSGILIISTWLISIIFGFLAFFNPNPRSFWQSCIFRNKNLSSNISFDFPNTESTVTILDNNINDLNGISEIMETVKSITLDENIDLIENTTTTTTVIFDTLINDTITYGFVYAIVYSIFAYFIPFVAVCWIYVSIYVAAHRNSERTRKSGSRPILSSSSFTEDQNGPPRLQRLQADTVEDFRKLPKISSLSSIDETSETMQPTGQLSRRRSFSSSMDIEESSPPLEDKASSGIVFTVNLQSVEVTRFTNDEKNCKNDLVIEGKIDQNKYREQSERNDKSLKEDEQVTDNWMSRSLDVEESNETENEVRFDYFDNLNKIHDKKLPLALCDDNSLKIFQMEGEESLNDEVKQNELKVIHEINDQREEHILQVDDDLTNQLSNQGDSKISPSPSEVRSNRRLSTFFNTEDTLQNTCEDSTKTEKDNNGSNVIIESSSCLLTPIVTITPAPSKNDSLHRVSSVRSTSSYINSLKDRISNGSIFRHREETRAARISALVIVMGLTCWSPYVILLVMKNLPRYTDQYLSHKYDILASSFFILAAYISPLLFGYRSKRVKRELRRFFCFRRELSYKNNRSLMAKKVLKRRHSSNLSHFEVDHKYNIFNCMYGRNRWPKEKVQFVQVPDTALVVETCRSSFSSGASTQISSTSTEEC